MISLAKELDEDMHSDWLLSVLVLLMYLCRFFGSLRLKQGYFSTKTVFVKLDNRLREEYICNFRITPLPCPSQLGR